MKGIRSILPCTLIFVTILFSACNKKEGCTDPQASNYDPDANKDAGCEYNYPVEMHFHPYVNDTAHLEGATYTIGGVRTQLNYTRFYVSHPRLIDAAGNETPAPIQYLLVLPEPDDYAIGDMPPGDYTGIRFEIGVGDSAVNHGDPSLYEIGDPLGAQFPSMHWGWSVGYIFLRIDGVTDTNGDNVPETGFEMHLGTEAYLTTITLDYPITIGEGQENIFHLNANWDRIFDGINLAVDHTTHTTDNLILAGQIQDNLFNFIEPED